MVSKEIFRISKPTSPYLDCPLQDLSGAPVYDTRESLTIPRLIHYERRLAHA